MSAYRQAGCEPPPPLTPAERAEQRRQDRLTAIQQVEQEKQRKIRELLDMIANLPEGAPAELTIDQIVLLRRDCTSDISFMLGFIPLKVGLDTGMRIYGRPVYCKP